MSVSGPTVSRKLSLCLLPTSVSKWMCSSVPTTIPDLTQGGGFYSLTLQIPETSHEFNSALVIPSRIRLYWVQDFSFPFAVPSVSRLPVHYVRLHSHCVDVRFLVTPRYRRWSLVLLRSRLRWVSKSPSGRLWVTTWRVKVSTLSFTDDEIRYLKHHEPMSSRPFDCVYSFHRLDLNLGPVRLRSRFEK